MAQVTGRSTTFERCGHLTAVHTTGAIVTVNGDRCRAEITLLLKDLPRAIHAAKPHLGRLLASERGASAPCPAALEEETVPAVPAAKALLTRAELEHDIAAAGAESHFQMATARIHPTPRLARGQPFAHWLPPLDVAGFSSAYDTKERPA